MRGGQTAKMAASNGGGMEVDATGEKFTRERHLTRFINDRLASRTLSNTHAGFTDIWDLQERPVRLALLLTDDAGSVSWFWLDSDLHNSRLPAGVSPVIGRVCCSDLMFWFLTPSFKVHNKRPNSRSHYWPNWSEDIHLILHYSSH